MRNRSLILLLTVLIATAFAAGCGTTRSIAKGDADKIDALQGNINKAIQMDAKACAPKELAYAEADVDQVRLEATQSWEAVKPEMTKAEKSVETLLKKIQECEDKKKVPTCNFVAEPETVAPGKCALLKWKGENVTKMNFGEEDPKAPDVSMSGTKEVCPKETTEYQMTCIGKGGTNYEFAKVAVEVPAPPPPPAPTPVVAPPPPPPPAPVAPKVIDKVALRINFDTGKAVIRKADAAEMKKAVDFLKKYPDAKVHVVGYTDSRGSEKMNMKLSEARADAVKKYLIANAGVKAGQITSEGKGPADPVGDNKTKAGQAMNRRVEIQILEK